MSAVSRLVLGIAFVAIAAVLCSFVPTAFGQQQTSQPEPTNISGRVTDKDGNVISGAQVTLTRDDQSPKQVVQSGDDGGFVFFNVAPGPFHLSIEAPAYATETYSGTMISGQNFMVPPIIVTLATVTTVIHVEPTNVVAERQIKVEEQQRVLKVIPNFYVSYIPNAAPLDAKQKAELSWKDAVDPVTFVLIGAIAGIQQSDDQFPGYGQGAQGYGKRYGASYADFATGTLFGSVIFPAILKQDPRYFYKGTGSKRSRILYAIANAVICKGDNGHWQPNYSGVLGNLASGGLSNLYYPPQSQNGVALTFEVTGVGIALTAADNLLQEFLIKKLTPSARKHDAASR
ncbi:MAG TPA: carboxypeptidase-like regulatory domain-containing protein [Candidatus Acidoferrales bacterium]|nr:carboxypeptidase-like regulatory domain-containing protein [Candidatus Acidoferrales bacterium]